MSRALVSRQELVLRFLVQEYIAKATPVASETLVRRHNLGISPATVRNYMAHLEEQGYITRPHTSAGSVPSGKAYRLYVQSLAKDIAPSSAEQRVISRLFDEAEKNSEEWVKVAAMLLARLVKNVALVTSPKASHARLKHLQLVPLTDRVALLIVVLQEIKVKQQLIEFAEAVTLDELGRASSRLNQDFAMLTAREIASKEVPLSKLEARVLRVATELLLEADTADVGRPYFEGLRLMLAQPEFSFSDRMLAVMRLVENIDWLRSVLSRTPSESDVHVVIGEESKDETLRDLSLVLSRYGAADEVGGTIGVLGPTRMDYARSIATVRYMSRVLSRLLEGLYGQAVIRRVPGGPR